MNISRPKWTYGQRFWRYTRPVLGIAAVASIIGVGFPASSPWDWAWADDHDDGSHSDGGHDSGSRGNGPGGSGGHDDGHDESDHDDGHEADGSRGPGGQGGGHDSAGDGEGDNGDGRDGGSGTDDRKSTGGGDGEGRGDATGRRGASGDKPAWAQEGVPEVELGRLNVARSPSQVLDRAFGEALASFTPEVAAFYRLDLDAMERELADNWENVRLIDSPLQNLALMRDALDGSSVLSTVGITTSNDTLLAAFLGTASDKEVPVSPDTVTAISAILGAPLSPAEAAALAEKAERIRRAILEGHG